LGIEQAGNLEATFQVEVTPRAIIHKIRKESEWVTVDAWEDPAGDFASGKFGFLISGRDQVALSDFSHQAR
jgi:hypothetical protein